MQDWPSTAFAAPRAHVWERFIKPAELVAAFARHGLAPREMRGISPRRLNPISMMLNFRRRVQGKLSFKELGQRMGFHEDEHLEVSYMGYAVKAG